MSIRNKILAILLSLLLVIAAVNFLIQRFVIYPSFLELEYQEISENLKRIIHAIDREIVHLDRLNIDWAAWDDTYAFMEEQSDDYIDSNLNGETLETNKFNLMLYCRPDGTIVWQHGKDFANGKELVFDFTAQGQVPANHPLLAVRDIDDKGKSAFGVYPSQFGLMIFSTREILRSDGTGPGKGYLIIARFLDAAFLKGLQEQTRIAFTIVHPLADDSSCGLNGGTVRQSGALRYVIQPEGDYVYTTCTLYKDKSGDPLFGLQYQFPREVTRKGIDSIRYATILLIALGAVIVLLQGLLLRYVILRPVQRLTEHAAWLVQEGDFSARLNLDRQDEIGRLAHSFDTMVATIDQQTRELKAANEQLIMMSMLDGLTGIANRRLFDTNISKEWRRAMREQTPLSLVMLDVDCFKNYNDTYGHQEGDRCLIAVAEALQGQVHRPADLVARYGGEEFVMVLPNTHAEGALLLAERAREAVQALGIEHRSSVAAPHVTVSLGVVTAVPAVEQGEEGMNRLLQQADQALYQAKRQGRNRTVAAA